MSKNVCVSVALYFVLLSACRLFMTNKDEYCKSLFTILNHYCTRLNTFSEPRIWIQWVLQSGPKLHDAMHSADYAVAKCPSVCPSYAGIVSRWVNISSNCFHHRVATSFWYFRTKRYGNIPTGTPKWGHRMQRVRRKIRYFLPISSFILVMIQDRAI